MSLLLCIDLDGTCCDATQRFAEAGKEPARHNKEQYEAWVRDVNKGMENDKPVSGMASLITIAGAMGLADVVYVTSREEHNRTATEEWLVKHRFPIFPLYMRPDGNDEETDVLKQYIINKAKYTYKASEVILIDDDQQGKLELMCKKNGYTFLKAMSGGKE